MPTTNTLAEIIHHGGRNGVTGSCHELRLAGGEGLLIDCGLFQGDEAPATGAIPSIDFALEHIQALVVTHVHIDHVGRIPYLLAAGFRGPILCSEASAKLLPLVLADAIKLGLTHDPNLIERVIAQIERQVVPLAYQQWHSVPLEHSDTCLRIKLKPAGHILGSAYVECDLTRPGQSQRVVFSGDLGAPYTPLLPAPRAPYRADTLVLESTYGDHCHPSRKERIDQLQHAIERALRNRGVVLIPAFSIGRTQELLYELEQLIHRNGQHWVREGLRWDDLEVVVDSPLAARFTQAYRQLRPFWDKEARRRLNQGRHPLNFEQLLTIDDHTTHLQCVDYLARTARPTIVLAASGMCTGGRVVNYLKALIGDARNDILFVGYQAAGTPGREIQKYGPRGGYVVLDGQRHTIRAGVATIPGYSAHADQRDLVNFVRRMRYKPTAIRLVHGEEGAKRTLKDELQRICPNARID